MVNRSMDVNLSVDAEARPVAVLVQIASQYESTIHIQAGDKKINAKSIMGMMSLGLQSGESIIVFADGKDEEAVLDHIEKFLAAE